MRQSIVDCAGRDVTNCSSVPEALRQAGEAWGVHKESLHDRDGNCLPTEYQALVRSDKGRGDASRYLSPVGSRFQPVSNQDVAQSLLQPLMSEGGLKLHRCGSTNGGKRVWISGKRPKNITVGQSEIGTSVICFIHHGAGSVTIINTATDFWCQNQLAGLTLGRGNATSSYSIPHIGNMRIKMQQIGQAIQNMETYIVEMEKIFNRMTRIKISNRFKEAYIQTLYPYNQEDSYKKRCNVNKHQAEIYRLYRKGLSHRNVRRETHDTAWGLLSAVTEYEEHIRANPTDHQRDEVASNDKFNREFFGVGQRRRSQAINLMTHAKLGRDGSLTLEQEAHQDEVDSCMTNLDLTSQDDQVDRILEQINV